MEIEPTRARFDLAAEPTVQRIRRDREASPRRIQPLLAYLEGHVYDLDLDYQQLKKACGVRDNTIPALFHQAAGLPPATYIRDCRMETAARLLAESDVKVWQISQLVGYSSLQVFGRAFKRWSKLSPVSYRRRHQKGAGKARRSGIAARRSSEISEALRRALQGQAAASEIGVVMQQLVELYPHAVRAVLAAPTSTKNGAPSTSPNRPLIALDRVQRIQAEAIWSRLADLPADKQRDVLRRDLRFKNPSFFHFLREKSRELGRDDRDRGLAIAELALESLGAIEPVESSEERATLATLAWVTIGNAKRLALDFGGAEVALDRAEQQLDQAAPSDALRAEVLSHRAALRWYERRFIEAAQLQTEVIGLLKRIGDTEAISLGLIRRGAIHLVARQPLAAVSDLEAALRLSPEDPHICQAALPNLAFAYVQIARFQEAAQLLPRARQAVAASPNRLHCLLLDWIDGLVSRGVGETQRAEHQIAAARDGLLEIGANEHAAAASLDLAELRLEMADTSGAAELAAEALPLLALLGTGAEAAAAHNALATALAAEKLTLEVVREVRTAVESLRGDPLLGHSMR